MYKTSDFENNESEMKILQAEPPPDAMQAEDTTQPNIIPVSERRTSLAEGMDNQPKKKKTRRGKCKRKPHYQKFAKKQIRLMTQQSIVEPRAPRNDNQFLLEDHGGLEELDENIKYSMDQASTTSVARTRDSSFSVDSEAEDIYSSPDDDEFLMKEFDDQYRSIQAEQLQVMPKEELIEKFLYMENRYQQKYCELEETIKCLEEELAKCKTDKETLERDITALKTKLEKQEQRMKNSDSEDSETDSSDSFCSSSSSESHSSNTAAAASGTAAIGADDGDGGGGGDSSIDFETPSTDVDPV